MKSDFTNNITHELKTPIAVAYAANDALLNFGQADEKAKRDKYLSISQEQLQRLSGLVEQILTMSMEQRKTFRLRPEEITLATLLESLTEQHKLKAQNPIDIDYRVEPANLTVFADPDPLQQYIEQPDRQCSEIFTGKGRHPHSLPRNSR